MSCGSTGMMTPKASMSSITVKKMKTSAARRTGVWAARVSGRFTRTRSIGLGAQSTGWPARPR